MTTDHNTPPTIATIKPGDTLIDIASRGWNAPPSLREYTVERVTKTQAIMTNGTRFKERNGRLEEMGVNEYYRERLDWPDSDVVAKIRRDSERRKTRAEAHRAAGLNGYGLENIDNVTKAIEALTAWRDILAAEQDEEATR